MWTRDKIRGQMTGTGCATNSLSNFLYKETYFRSHSSLLSLNKYLIKTYDVLDTETELGIKRISQSHRTFR